MYRQRPAVDNPHRDEKWSRHGGHRGKSGLDSLIGKRAPRAPRARQEDRCPTNTIGCVAPTKTALRQRRRAVVAPIQQNHLLGQPPPSSSSSSSSSSQLPNRPNGQMPFDNSSIKQLQRLNNSHRRCVPLFVSIRLSAAGRQREFRHWEQI
jgi:hypothetical protein